VNLQPGHRQPAPAVRQRQWRFFDFDGFCDNLHQSVLLANRAGRLRQSGGVLQLDITVTARPTRPVRCR